MGPSVECCLPSSPKTIEEPAKALFNMRVTTSPATARARSPKAKRVTITAKMICRLSPQATVRQRMARRSVEKSHASSSMVSSPRIPVNLAKGISFKQGLEARDQGLRSNQVYELICILCGYIFIDERRNDAGFLSNEDRFAQECLGFSEFFRSGGKDCD